jgi:arginyl-tRNA synthetase
MQKIISKHIAACIPELTETSILSLLEVPPDSKLGDYAFPCFSLAKQLHKSPVKIAEALKEELDSQHDTRFQKVEAVKGYLNIYVNKTYVIEQVMEQIMKDTLLSQDIGQGRTICLDYSSPNIAKKFHIGHLRTTIIGNSLSKIYQKLGYKVVRINHLGDWGTQFGKLIVAYQKWSSKEKIQEEGIDELLRIYVKFHKEAKKEPALIEEARNWFVKMEKKDEEALDIWKWFMDISMIEFKYIYNLLKVEFDYYTGESFYQDMIPVVLKQLNEKNLLTLSDGAQIVDLSSEQLPPCLIAKKDGSSIYPTRDIAAAIYRKDAYGFSKCIYVTGAEQVLHFNQVFRVLDKLGYSWSESLVHVPYGLVSMSGEKLSTRTGNIIYARELLLESIERAQKAIEIKNPVLPDKVKTAEQVGIGAVIFHDLFTQRIKNIDFKWEEVLSFEGASGPYIQYTYARAKSILRKNKDYTADVDIDFNVLSEEHSYQLIKGFSNYTDAVLKAAENYEPSMIARYVLNLAQDFNKFYHKCPINQSDNNIKKARLLLVYGVQKLIGEAMSLLGIECPEEM